VSTAREEVLARIRLALADRPTPAEWVRGYLGADGAPPDQARFAARVGEYGAGVHASADVAAVVRRLSVSRLIVPADVDPSWLAVGVPVVRDEPPIALAELDAGGAVLTGCAVAIAETGTVVLDHGAGQGRRALTLVPDHHIVVVRAGQLVARVPDAFARLGPGTAQTWISGPSATSDVELARVAGVHGPRRLDVVLVPDAGAGDTMNPTDE
jgi:L-lactate dehydrogenase complex protein LldG